MMGLSFFAVRSFSVSLALCLAVAACGAETDAAEDGEEPVKDEALRIPPRSFVYIQSAGNGMAMNAWGGAREGARLGLHEACTTANLDCLFTIEPDFTIRSARDRSLFLNAYYGARDQAELVLTRACNAENPDCSWNFDPTTHTITPANHGGLMVNAWGGAQHGAQLLLTNLCTEENPDCLWYQTTVTR